MTIVVGDVVKCAFDFAGEVETDLSLSVGDLVKIAKVINADWLEGICNGTKGSFPVAFVEQSKEVFDVGIAIARFDAEQTDDLSLEAGDYIVILEIIDESWLRGTKKGGEEGMFPRNFIKYISFDNLPNDRADVPQVETMKPSEEIADASPAITVEAQENNNWVTVVEKFSSQGQGELNLYKGSQVRVIRFVDGFWCEGETPEGIVGIFPAAFVKLPQHLQEELDGMNEATSQAKTENLENNINDEFRVKSDKPLQQGFEANDEFLQQEINTSNEYLSQKTYNSATTTALALYDYVSSEPGDLNFTKGEVIEVMETIDENWLRGRIGEHREGMFAACYIELQKQSLPEQKDIAKEVAYNVAKSIESTEHVEKYSQVNLVVEPPSSEEKSKVTVESEVVVGKKPSPRVVKKEINKEINLITAPLATKKSPPSRPKPPAKREEEDLLKNYVFSTESQPYLIIPFEYRKPGEPTKVILRKV